MGTSEITFQAADGNLLDGSAFHKGTRLRRDCAIRESLRGGTAGWAIVKLKASDLRRGVLADWIR